jgi:6-pyruvoyltetrahydropterin/6-carboxytetrahydropterin synthase
MKTAKQFRWEMGHRLPYHETGCQNIHGHSYKLIVEFEGEVDSQGMLIDYGDIKRIVKPIVEELDHSFMCYDGDVVMKELLVKADLKAVYVPFQATAENLCTYFMQYIKKELVSLRRESGSYHRNIRHIKIRVCETESTYAEVEETVTS